MHFLKRNFNAIKSLKKKQFSEARIETRKTENIQSPYYTLHNYLYTNTEHKRVLKRFSVLSFTLLCKYMHYVHT